MGVGIVWPVTGGIVISRTFAATTAGYNLFFDDMERVLASL
jgi:hypothetical protein